MLDLADIMKLAAERFKDPVYAMQQLLRGAIVNDYKGIKIERLDGSMETYVVKRITWGDPREQ